MLLVTSYDLEVFDLAGRKAQTAHMANNQKELDISTLPSGLYILTLSNGKHFGRKRFVKY